MQCFEGMIVIPFSDLSVLQPQSHHFVFFFSKIKHSFFDNNSKPLTKDKLKTRAIHFI